MPASRNTSTNRSRDHVHAGYATKTHTHGKLCTMSQVVAYTGSMQHKHPFSVGTATIPSLALSATTQVTVTLAVAMTDAAYVARPFISGSVTLLAALSVTLIEVLSASQVRCTVQNTGLVTLSGGELVVLAIGSSS